LQFGSYGNLLDRDFTATKPNQKWVTDITYLPTHAGWVYLAAVLDLFSRKVVGWAISDSLATPWSPKPCGERSNRDGPSAASYCITAIEAANTRATRTSTR